MHASFEVTLSLWCVCEHPNAGRGGCKNMEKKKQNNKNKTLNSRSKIISKSRKTEADPKNHGQNDGKLN